jgi:metal-dependent HD superfamily phosphatase/phosphodiesterase
VALLARLAAGSRAAGAAEQGVGRDTVDDAESAAAAALLFNALHSIGTLVHEDPEAAENMLLCVGQLLRAFLEDKQSDEVTLRKELAMLEYHLEVERIRFGRLTICTAIDMVHRFVFWSSRHPRRSQRGTTVAQS